MSCSSNPAQRPPEGRYRVDRLQCYEFTTAVPIIGEDGMAREVTIRVVPQCHPISSDAKLLHLWNSAVNISEETVTPNHFPKEEQWQYRSYYIH